MRRFGDIFPNPFLNIYYELEIIFNPSYTPTWSSLDLVNYEEINQTTGDFTTIGQSKFDDYVVQTTSVYHSNLSTETRNNIVTWLAKNFNISVGYNLPEGGYITPDNYQVQILHGKSITVQPKTVTVNGKQVVYTFSMWDDGNTENPRTFYTSHDVSHTASMKAHLSSSTTTATANNGQRKIVSSGSNTYMTYQSSGDIWFTSSSDGGAIWSPEQKVSTSLEGSQRLNPSIDVDNFNNVYIAYEVITDASHRVLLLKNKTSNGWNSFNYGDYFVSSSNITPVIHVNKLGIPGYYKIVVVVKASGYEDGTHNSDVGLYYLYFNTGQGEYINKVSETSSSTMSPTLTWYNLSYAENNDSRSYGV